MYPYHKSMDGKTRNHIPLNYEETFVHPVDVPIYYHYNLYY